MRGLKIKKEKPIVIASWGDTHPNSTVGLIPPRGIALDDGGWYRPSDVQLEIWNVYLEYWDAVKERKREVGAEQVWGVFGGEGVDDNKYSKYQLATVNESVMLDIGVSAMRPAMDVVDRQFCLRSTEAHSGGSSWMEERLAKELGAEQDPDTGNSSWWFLPMEKYGVRSLFAHHPYSTARRPWTIGGGANRTAEMIEADYNKTQDPLPHFAVFHHAHAYETSSDNHEVDVTICYPFCVTGALGHRIGYSGRSSEIGGLVYTLFPDGTWDKKRFRRTPRRKEPWTDQ